MPHPLDEFPVHQAPLSMRYAASSDRNFYDRYYFNAHDRTGDIFLITGLGIYPNLGVIDAYATLRRGDRQLSVRMSDALGDERLNQHVGPYRIEVIEPLEKIRLICDAGAQGLAFDLTWDGSFPAVEEPRHVWRQGGRITLDACRFAQVGTWTGEIEAEGEKIAVTPDRWLGTRDRSWGIRPVGEGEAPGRFAAEQGGDYGMYWLYVPLRFDNYAIVIIVQEDADGHRTLSEASRIWPAASGRRSDQLGWPRTEIHYRSGTRIPEKAVIHLTAPDGKPARAGSLIVTFKSGVQSSSRDAAHREQQAQAVEQIDGTGAARVQVEPGTLAQALASYSARSDVQQVQPDYVVYASMTPNDPRYGDQWGPNKIQAPAACSSRYGNRAAAVLPVSTP